jgi:hypothetical protein
MALDMTTALVINARVNGEQQITGLANGLRGVAGASNQSATAMGRLNTVGNGLAGVFRTLGPIIASIGAIKFAKDNIDAADALSKLSDRTGVAVPVLDQFRQVADLSDTSIESLGKAFPTLAKNIVDAANGTGPAVDAFDQLGIKLTDATGQVRATDDVMKDIMDRFKGMEDGTQKAALASEIFGKRLGSELIPFLNSGSDAVNDMSTAMTQEFADKSALFNDKVTAMTEKLNALGVEIVTAILPALEAFVDFVTPIVDAFVQLPEPVQAAAIAFGALAIAVGLLAPLIGPISAAFSFIAGLNIAAIIGTIGSAISGIIGVLTSFGAALVATIGAGPLAIGALLIAAGVAIYVFRDKIADAFKAIGKFFVDLPKGFNDKVLRPVTDAAKAVVKGIVDAFKGLANALKAPFDAVARFIRAIFNSYLGMVEKFINGAISGINKLIAAANRALSALKLPTIPTVSNVNLPRFAQGGVVNGPTVAMVGEGGQREYIIPESKMARASANYLMGMRGASVIPDSAAASASQGNTTVQIKTGPVLQQGGQRYVTIDDLERSLNSLAANLLGNGRSFAGRRFQGAI